MPSLGSAKRVRSPPVEKCGGVGVLCVVFSLFCVVCVFSLLHFHDENTSDMKLPVISQLTGAV